MINAGCQDHKIRYAPLWIDGKLTHNSRTVSRLSRLKSDRLINLSFIVFNNHFIISLTILHVHTVNRTLQAMRDPSMKFLKIDLQRMGAIS